MKDIDRVLNFWFEEISAENQFKKNPEFDKMIVERFGKLHASAAKGELFAWRENAAGSLAEIIVLDQFSRNMYRDTPGAFATDGIAVVLAQQMVQHKQDASLDAQKKMFCYMPYMHSESLVVHEKALELFTDLGNELTLEFEVKHKVIIERFGRYPHRNEILGRKSTPEEIAFLKEPNSNF